MRRWRCTSRFDPWGKGVRTGPHRQFAKRYFYFGQKRAILYNRIGEMNSSGDVRQLQSEQFCRTNSHPARGRNLFSGKMPFLPDRDSTHTPQGDVKNEAMFSLLPKFKNLTHTPQGDVSLKWPKFFLFGLGFNPHPARGRKILPCSDFSPSSAIQLTPRKGTQRKSLFCFARMRQKRLFCFFKNL